MWGLCCHLEFHNDRVWTVIGFAYNFVYEISRDLILVAISMFSGSINPIRTVKNNIWLINLAVGSHLEYQNGHCGITTKTGIVYIYIYRSMKLVKR